MDNEIRRAEWRGAGRLAFWVGVGTFGSFLGSAFGVDRVIVISDTAESLVVSIVFFGVFVASLFFGRRTTG